MPTPANRRHWRHFLIKPSIQLRLVASHALFLLIVAVLTATVLLRPFYSDLYRSNELWAQYAAAEIWLRLVERGALILVITAAISAVYHIVFSHRLCGPLINLNHTFDALIGGDTTRLVFLRRRDYLKEEALKINRMLAAIDTRVNRLKGAQADMINLVDQLPASPEKAHLSSAVLGLGEMLAEWTTTTAQPESRSRKETFPD